MMLLSYSLICDVCGVMKNESIKQEKNIFSATFVHVCPNKGPQPYAASGEAPKEK